METFGLACSRCSTLWLVACQRLSALIGGADRSMFPSLLARLPESFDADKPPLGVVTPRPALVWPGPSGLVAGEECLIFGPALVVWLPAI